LQRNAGYTSDFDYRFQGILKAGGGLLKEVISPSNFTDAETEGLMNEKLF